LTGCASTVFSDLTFCALTYLTLLALAARSGPRPGRGVAVSLLAGVVASAGYLVRGNGITLLISAVLDPLHGPRRWWRSVASLATIAGVLMLVRCIPASTHRPVPSGDYWLELQAGWSTPGLAMATASANLAAVLLDFPTHVSLPVVNYCDPVVRGLARQPLASSALRLAISGVVLLGLIRLARSRRCRLFPMWCHAAGTIAIFLAWPWTMILDRFLLSVFPLVLLSFWTGLRVIERMINSRAGFRLLPQGIALATLIVTGVGASAVTARSIHKFHLAGGQWPGASDRRALAEVLALISNQVEPDAVVAARWPDTVFLHTGRQAVPLTEDDAILRGRFDESDRLRLWMEQVPGKPFYLLLRSALEDLERADLRQAEALAATPGITLRPESRTSDGRYEIVRVVR
jgi:hypothetical protein